ncbi:hypothetical protein HYY70_04555 [Candidatus Woesearchaeota archaeon]|nr:hypothetical protein [Candidatus Woesearchaeota archaeon]
MNKKVKKITNKLVFAVALVALISIVVIAYAQGESQSRMSGNMMDMMGGNGMGKMHEQMTKGLDIESKEQMDEMHEQCEKLHKENDTMQ